MINDYVVVTAISTYRMRYVMHKDDLRKLNADVIPTENELIDWAQDTVTMEQCEEFSQHWLGEQISDIYPCSEDEMLELFDRDNDYLKNWDRDSKIQRVRNSLPVCRRYVEYEGKKFDASHGGPFDRGAADSYYGRPRKPHFYTGGTGTSTLVPQYGMSMEAIEEYYAGYEYNEERGDKKEW